jgi:parallel beta-helix repeat protein
MRRTHKKTASAMIVALLFSSLLALANLHLARATGTIYIRSDGSVDPSSAPIQRSGNTYTFTGDIFDPIVVEKNDIMIDGASHILQGLMNSPGIDLSSRTNVTVRSVTITDFDYGIYLESSDHITISGATLINNNNGLWLSSSSYNVIVGNTINTNVFEGLYVYFSSNNLIQTNLVKSNTFDGIYLFFSESNNISENRIEDNAYGISPYYSSNNRIFHNSFVNNQISANPNEPADIWDDGYPSGGNYWSDFNPEDVCSGPYQNETGSDKIGDVLYVINANNTDNYPLIYPFGYVPTPDVNQDGRINVLDIVKVALAFGSVPGMSNWNPYVDINQDLKINILDLVAVAINFGKQWPPP